MTKQHITLERDPGPNISYEVEPGAHPGWTNYWFRWKDLDLRLLTIESDGETRSGIINESSHVPRTKSGLYFGSLHFAGILTVETAIQILNMREEMYGAGQTNGANNLRRQIGKILEFERE